MQTRLKILGTVFVFASLGLVARLFFWQVIRASYLSSQARLQYKSGIEVFAKRGNILASDGTWLAASSESWLVFAYKPEMKQDARTVANKLAGFFADEEEVGREGLLTETMRIEGLLEDNEVVWVSLKNKVGAEVKKNIEALGIDGIDFELQEQRFYPEASSSAHLLGFVGKDDDGIDKGYFGLEGFYDISLGGKPGFIQRESDAAGTPIVFGDLKEIAAVGGVDLITHVDKGVQLLVEEKLKDGLEKYGAVSGTVIVMDPRSGGIVAMASFPSYDPLEYFEYGDSFFRNPAISTSFEPGSIFKPLVMASALDAGVVKPDTQCDICDGPVKVDKYTIETWNKEYFPDSTMTDIIVHSDNVGMTFVGEKLGLDAFYDYLDRFGIGKQTGVDLQGEENPRLRAKEDWTIVDLATITFGQGVATTPIQIVKAFSAIANDGVMMRPQVVNKIKIDSLEKDLPSVEDGRVISSESASQIKDMMVQAAREGEAKWTAVRGFRVAGKTGTAQIPIAGHYDEEKTIASFIGFAPADDPKFLMLVTMREPTNSPWASETAAPLWFSIATDLFPYFGIQPEN